MQLGFTDGEEKTLAGQMLYYARRAGYLEGALGLIAAGTTGVDPQVAAQRALDAVGPDVVAEQDTTPARNDTPGECTVSPEGTLSGTGQSPEPDIPPAWLQKPYYVDPPSGHRYGFPRLYDPKSDGDMTEWMIRNGYPEKMARQGLACTFTAAE
jgi:hypothetical protein